MSAANDTGPISNSTPQSQDGCETSADARWQASLDGDQDAFQRLLKPHVEELLTAARRDIRYHLAVGDLERDDISAEELVGDTLLRAWRDRSRRPPSLDIRPWLLGLQFRVLTGVVRQEELRRKLLSVSLEAPAPATPEYDDDESFWEWYQPDDALRWEDIVAAGPSFFSSSPSFFSTAAPSHPSLSRQVILFLHIQPIPFG